jgi:uncharacterized protein (TIGR02118 family)
MLKTVWFVRFRDGVDPAEGDRFWAEEHGPMILELPGVIRYVQNTSVSAATLEGAIAERPAFDGFAAIWWASREQYYEAMRSPAWKAIEEDAARIFDIEWTRSMCAEMEERVMRVGLGAKADGVSTPPGKPIKLIGLLVDRPGMHPFDVNEYWAGTHGDIALTIKQIGHYTQNHILRAIRGNEGTALGFGGFSESWYENEAVYEEAMDSKEWKELGDDGPNLFDMTVFKSAWVEERVLRG